MLSMYNYKFTYLRLHNKGYTYANFDSLGFSPQLSDPDSAKNARIRITHYLCGLTEGSELRSIYCECLKNTISNTEEIGFSDQLS
jgi:hypothetical protein